MFNLNKKIVILALLSVLVTFSVVALAHVTSDTTKRFVEQQAFDYIRTGEDVFYDSWVKQFKNANNLVDEKLLRESQQYTTDLRAKANLREWRNTSFAQADASLVLKAKVIVGQKKGERITYTSNDVKTGYINLPRLYSVLQQGEVNGLFIEDGHLYVTIDPGRKPAKGFNNLLIHDIPVLLRGVFTSADYSIWQTIDPPQNPADQQKFGIVRYGGGIEQTHVGAVLFEADRIMKCLSNGYDNRTGKQMSKRAWAKSEWDFMPPIEMEDTGANDTDEWHRFWFTIDESPVLVDSDAKMVKLTDGGVIKVKNERMIMVNGELKSSFQPVEGTPPQQWVDHFNANFAAYQRDFPVLAELESLGRWTALLLALRECGVLFEEIEVVNLSAQVLTPSKTAVIKVVTEREVQEETEENILTTRRQMMLIGGVDYQNVQVEERDLERVKAELVKQYEQGELVVERVF